MRHLPALSVALGVLTVCSEVRAQSAARNVWGYDFPPNFDAEVAAPNVHRVHYADDHIMLMEVANPPGYPMQMHGHPYPSIFARTSGSTHLGGGGPSDQYLEPAGGRNGEHWHSAPAPKHTPSLECTAADPQAPHRPVNHASIPQHFYRIEFKHLGDLDKSAPLAHGRSFEKKLYEDAVVRLIEINIAVGGKSRLHAIPYPSVLAIDTETAFKALDAALGPDAGRSLPPDTLSMPRCMTVDAGPQLDLPGSAVTPIHFYRLEFKRVEGDDLKDHWRQWYPFMTSMK